MDILYIVKTVILGIVQGLTEFLPISSTGHMIITADVLRIESDAFNKMFMVVVQLASVLAVLLLYWSRIWTLFKAMLSGQKAAWRFFAVWVLGCIPAVFAGLLFEDFIDRYLFSVPTVIAALIVGALLLLYGERSVTVYNKERTMEQISWKQALVVGLAQCLSLWPGFSRSASTIMGGWSAGLTTAAAADYSFFLAIPIMFGASGWSLFKFLRDSSTAVQTFSSTQLAALLLGCVVSFLVAFFVVKAFLGFLKRKPLRYFAYYRLGLAVVILLLLFLGVLN